MSILLVARHYLLIPVCVCDWAFNCSISHKVLPCMYAHLNSLNFDGQLFSGKKRKRFAWLFCDSLSISQIPQSLVECRSYGSSPMTSKSGLLA